MNLPHRQLSVGRTDPRIGQGPRPGSSGRWRRNLALWLTLAAGCAAGVTRAHAAGVPAPSAGEAVPLHVGISHSVFRNTNYNDAVAAYRIFLQRIAARQGHAAEIEVSVFDDRDAFALALSDSARPLHLSVVMAWDFLQMDLPATIQPQFVVAGQDTPGRHYCLLTHRQSGLHQLGDLQGKSLLDFDIGPGTQGWNWLNIVLNEAGLPPATAWFGEISGTAKVSATVLPVFFRTRDACIIDEPSFALMSELNPQVSRDLQVVARSDALADVVICLSESGWPDDRFRHDIITALGDLPASPEGRQLLTLFKISRLVPFEPRYLDASRALLARLHRSERRRHP